MSSKVQNLILLAKVGAAHGIKGEVRVKPYGDPEMLDQYGKLETADGRKLRIKRLRPQKNMLVVKFENVNSREEAEALNGCELFVDRQKMPDPEDEDEFYISDLIGMKVLSKLGEELGTVRDVPNFGADDMLEIQPLNGANTYFLPFTNSVVPEIDLTNKIIVVDPPVEVSERDEMDDAEGTEA